MLIILSDKISANIKNLDTFSLKIKNFTSFDDEDNAKLSV